jgi:FkbM family methyltransferase
MIFNRIKCLNKIFDIFSEYFHIAHFNRNSFNFKKIYPYEFANIFNSTYSNQINTYGVYHYPVLKKITECIKKNYIKNNIYLDIGANIGDQSIYFSKIFKKVIAYEPHPRIYKILKFNTDFINNININNVGLYNKKKKAFQNKFFHNNFTSAVHNNSSGYNVTLDTADKILKRSLINKINFVNITADGSEYKILNGMKELLSSQNLEIMMIQISNNKQFKKIIKYLKKYNFKNYYFFYSREINFKSLIIKIFYILFNKNFDNNFIKVVEGNKGTDWNDSLKHNVLFARKRMSF